MTKDIGRWGYCTECKKMVPASFEDGFMSPDVPEEYWELPEAVCSICGSEMPVCLTCRHWEVFEEDRNKPPWYSARGHCPLGVVLAGNFACPLYEEREN